MQSVESWRLFIAISLPEDVRHEIERVQAEWRKSAPRHAVRWTNGAQLHLTLKFLGDLPAAQLDALTSRLRGVARQSKPLRLSVRGTGAFPNTRAPRVLWIGVNTSDDGLLRLQQAIESAVAEFLPPGESSGTFTGHITLGRVREESRALSRVVADLVAAAAGREFGQWTAAAFELVRSELSPDGARHTRLSEFLLGPEAGAT